MLYSNHDLRDQFADQWDVNPFDCGIRVILRENEKPKKVIFTLPDGQSFMMTRTSTDVSEDKIVNNWNGIAI